jgi:hypothetical protein
MRIFDHLFDLLPSLLLLSLAAQPILIVTIGHG